jgi:hypothetical protein
VVVLRRLLRLHHAVLPSALQAPCPRLFSILALHPVCPFFCTMRPPQIKGMSNSDLTFEILGARSKLVDCGVPEADIAGFRAPFLSSDIADRTFLYENGFKYDRCEAARKQQQAAAHEQPHLAWLACGTAYVFCCRPCMAATSITSV